jgi:hypothetical protein
VEVDLEKGLPIEILMNLDNYKHVQKLDYEQLPFKHKACHEYGHFAKDCKKTVAVQAPSKKEDQW